MKVMLTTVLYLLFDVLMHSFLLTAGGLGQLGVGLAQLLRLVKNGE